MASYEVAESSLLGITYALRPPHSRTVCLFIPIDKLGMVGYVLVENDRKGTKEKRKHGYVEPVPKFATMVSVRALKSGLGLSSDKR